MLFVGIEAALTGLVVLVLVKYYSLYTEYKMLWEKVLQKDPGLFNRLIDAISAPLLAVILGIICLLIILFLTP